MDISMARRREGMPTFMSGYAICGVGLISAPPGLLDDERKDIRICVHLAIDPMGI